MGELIVTNLSKSFGSVKALEKVNFSAKFGEVHALLGENGAGKSTLIKILSGYQTADEGTITINGEEYKATSPTDAINKGIGTVYQELSLMHDLTVAQNLFFEHWPEHKGFVINKKKLYREAQELLARYDIDDIDPYLETSKLTLSQQQMVEIVKVLMKDPKVVILDEATSALTTNRVEWLLNLARKLADEGKLVIFITHRLQEVKSSCDRMTVFRNGQSVGVRENIDLDDDEIISLMIGRSMEQYFPERIDHTVEEPLLEVDDLYFEGLLNHVSFTLKKGEVLGVGGLAGQGQLPMFEALGGIFSPHGTIVIDGKKLGHRTPRRCIDNGIVLIPEDRARHGLIQTRSIKENISLPALKKISKLGIINKKAERTLVQSCIDKLQVKLGSPDDKISSLSGGNQQKVLISKFMANDPKVFLMMDPTRGVDVGTKSEIFKLVRQLAEEGCGVLYYSTDMEELVNVCDRVMVMCDYKVVGTLTRENMTKENILKLSVGQSI